MVFSRQAIQVGRKIVGLTSQWPYLELRQAVNSCPTLMAIYFEWATSLQKCGRCHKRQLPWFPYEGWSKWTNMSHGIYLQKLNGWSLKPGQERKDEILHLEINHDVQVPFCHFITVNGCPNFKKGCTLLQFQDRMLTVERWTSSILLAGGEIMSCGYLQIPLELKHFRVFKSAIPTIYLYILIHT